MVDGRRGGVDDSPVEHVVEVVALRCRAVQRAVGAVACQQPAEVERGLLLCRGLACRYQLSVAHYVVEPCEAHLGQVFAHLFGQEHEVVDQVLVFAHEMLAQPRVLGGHSHGASVQVALAHHHASQHDEGRRAEPELLGAEQRHGYHVASGLELSVGLQPDVAPQPVSHERLLCLGQANLGRYAGEPHA